MMKLGIISDYNKEALAFVKSKHLNQVEFTINHNEKAFFDALSKTNELLDKYDLEVMSIGRWGTDRITKDGINEDEYAINEKMVDACVQLNSPVYVTGVNYVEDLTYEENMSLAIAYLKRLNDYAKEKGIKVAIYNCRWNNFLIGPKEWEQLLNEISDLGIKYDPSHAIYDHQDYLEEIKTYGKHIYHFHLKGSLAVNGERVDDPPAGLDITDWKAVMSLLYFHGYDGGLSIEPHSATWKDELGSFGIDYTINYFKPMIYGGNL